MYCKSPFVYYHNYCSIFIGIESGEEGQLAKVNFTDSIHLCCPCIQCIMYIHTFETVQGKPIHCQLQVCYHLSNSCSVTQCHITSLAIYIVKNFNMQNHDKSLFINSNFVVFVLCTKYMCVSNILQSKVFLTFLQLFHIFITNVLIMIVM